VPVYATGRIYSGEPDPARNQDHDGVRFPATPWALAHARRQDLPGLASLRNGAMAALFALGQDAWNLLPWLELMRKDAGFIFPGQSGNYRMDRSGSLHREPAWAVFSNGLPAALPPPAADAPPPAQAAPTSNQAAPAPTAPVPAPPGEAGDDIAPR
jgi:outer membrane PBP1 activator LpoA protein